MVDDEAPEHDLLTGLPNLRALRAEFADTFSAEALIVVKLTNFVWINMSHGPVVADRVLQQVAGHLRRQAPRSELVYRIGGDQFIVVWLDAPQSDPVSWAARHVGELRELLQPYETAELRSASHHTRSLQASYSAKQGWSVANERPEDEPVLLTRSGVVLRPPRAKTSVTHAVRIASTLADQARGLCPPLLTWICGSGVPASIEE